MICRGNLAEPTIGRVRTGALMSPVGRSSKLTLSGGLQRSAAWHAALPRVLRRLLMRLGSAARMVAAVLREIFDESAYQRFLEQRQVNSSPEAYSVFRREIELAKARRPRCC